MTYEIEMACISHIGYIRENNEDNFYFDNHILSVEHGSMEEPLIHTISSEKIETVAVFDGMGGENAGEVASYAAAKNFRQICHIPQIDKPSVLHMIETLNQEVCIRAKMDTLGQIGCTATILFFYQKYAYLTNVGDSPAYIWRNGKLKLISEKHTDEEFLRLTNVKSRKPALTQFLGIPREEMLLEPYLAGIEMQAGDVFLICSDGLTDMVPEMEIQDILGRNADVSQMVKGLLQEALLAGGNDNTTIICCKVMG